ncbi:MAG: hypothetical protein IV108_06005 [Burkholderiales bacterium]|nr:hypothetical protein [Burkholderiales bacterium]
MQSAIIIAITAINNIANIATMIIVKAMGKTIVKATDKAVDETMDKIIVKTVDKTIAVIIARHQHFCRLEASATADVEHHARRRICATDFLYSERHFRVLLRPKNKPSAHCDLSD